MTDETTLSVDLHNGDAFDVLAEMDDEVPSVSRVTCDECLSDVVYEDEYRGDTVVCCDDCDRILYRLGGGLSD